MTASLQEMTYRRKLARGALQAAPRPKIIVLMGASGSGKSTFAQTLEMPVVSTDQIREEMGIIPGTFDRENLVLDEFRRRVREALALHGEVVADSTGSLPEYRLPFLNEAPEILKLLAVMMTPLQVCLEVNRARVREGKRGCPESGVQAQYEEIQRDIPRLGREGWKTILFL